MKFSRYSLINITRFCLIFFASLISSISLLKFWYSDLIIIEFIPFSFSGIVNNPSSFFLLFILLGTTFLLITYLKKPNLKTLFILSLVALLQLPLIYILQRYKISLTSVVLHALLLSLLMSVYTFLWVNHSKFTIYGCFSKNLHHVIFLFFTIFYYLFSLIRHYSFSSNGQDLGVYLQTIYQLGHSAEPSLTNWYGTIHPFAVHFEPILYLFTPFELLGILIPVLLLIQVLGFSLGILGIFKLAKLFKQPQIVPILISLAYGFSLGIQHAVVFDFHTTMLMPSFIIFIFYFILKKDLKKTFILALFFLLIKEDAAVYTIFFGIYAFWVTRNIVLSSILITGASIYGYVAVGKIIPGFGKGDIVNFVFDRLGNNIFEAVQFIIKKPLQTLLIFLTPLREKIAVIFSTILHGGLVPLLGYKELILLIPMLAMRFFTDFDRMWGYSMYYAAPSVAVVAVASLVGYSKVKNDNRVEKIALLSLIYGAIFSFLLGTVAHIPGYYSSSIWRSLGSPEFYSRFSSREVVNVRRALKLIPESASVCASQGISPHLSTRSKSAFYGSSVCDDSYDYVILDVNLNNWPLSEEDLANVIFDLRKNPNYSIVFSIYSTVVFSKDSRDGAVDFSPYLEDWVTRKSTNYSKH